MEVVFVDWKTNNEILLEKLKEVQKACLEQGIKLGIHHFEFNHISELWGHNNIGIINASLSVIVNCEKLSDDIRDFSFEFLNWNAGWKISTPIHLHEINKPTVWMLQKK
jgi:hypothetical protein